MLVPQTEEMVVVEVEQVAQPLQKLEAQAQLDKAAQEETPPLQAQVAAAEEVEEVPQVRVRLAR